MCLSFPETRDTREAGLDRDEQEAEAADEEKPPIHIGEERTPDALSSTSAP